MFAQISSKLDSVHSLLNCFLPICDNIRFYLELNFNQILQSRQIKNVIVYYQNICWYNYFAFFCDRILFDCLYCRNLLLLFLFFNLSLFITLWLERLIQAPKSFNAGWFRRYGIVLVKKCLFNRIFKINHWKLWLRNFSTFGYLWKYLIWFRLIFVIILILFFIGLHEVNELSVLWERTQWCLWLGLVVIGEVQYLETKAKVASLVVFRVDSHLTSIFWNDSLAYVQA